MLLQSTARQVTGLASQLAGLAALAALVAAVAALAYRWYVREPVPRGLALLVGLSGVAIYLNTTTALGRAISGDMSPTELEVALFNIAAFLSGAAGAVGGRSAGDRFGTDVLLGEASRVDGEVSRLVRTVGRVIVVELPDEIDDVVGYDPVPDATKETLEGKKFVFPRRLTVGELRDRLVARLKADYAVGTVDVELAADGSVEFLALGSRAAGLGPTLPPATNAVCVRADPAFAASAGDLVQVWETDPMRRVTTAELRGVAGDVVTLAIDAADTQKIDPTRRYRLVTLPVDDRPEREFASLLRAAPETFSSVTVGAGSPLHGMPVGGLDVAVVSVDPAGAEPVVLPGPEQILAPGDVVFAIARPDALRRLGTAAEPLDPSLARGAGDAAGGTAPGGAVDGTRDATPAEATELDRATAEEAEPTPEEETGGGDGVEPADADSGGEETGEEPVGLEEADIAFESGEDEPAAPDPGDGSDEDDLDALFEEGNGELETLDIGGEPDDQPTFEEGGGPGGTPGDDGGNDEGDGADEDGEDGDGADEDGEDGDTDSEDGEDGDTDSEDGEDGSDDADEEGEENGNDDSEDGDGGGGSASFQQLKEEFESGEADWEDDVSDSPGGDMRLDE